MIFHITKISPKIFYKFCNDQKNLTDKVVKASFKRKKK